MADNSQRSLMQGCQVFILLEKGLFCSGAFGDLLLEALVCQGQVSGTLGDLFLQPFIKHAQLGGHLVKCVG